MPIQTFYLLSNISLSKSVKNQAFSVILVHYLYTDLFFSAFLFIDSVATSASYYYSHYRYIMDIFIAIQTYIYLSTYS